MYWNLFCFIFFVPLFFFMHCNYEMKQKRSNKNTKTKKNYTIYKDMIKKINDKIRAYGIRDALGSRVPPDVAKKANLD